MLGDQTQAQEAYNGSKFRHERVGGETNPKIYEYGDDLMSTQKIFRSLEDSGEKRGLRKENNSFWQRFKSVLLGTKNKY